ncbi:hypothetical protein MTO96_042262, partial [Rhipicephalus appendiculatus]
AAPRPAAAGPPSAPPARPTADTAATAPTGFYRNDERKCVALDQCPQRGTIASWPIPSCRENEEWKVCVSSSCAEATCERKTIGPECTLDCQRGCYCSRGFYRNSQGNCVREDQCPTTD